MRPNPGFWLALAIAGGLAATAPADADEARSRPASPAASPAAGADLGRIQFPVTVTAAAARQHFLRGVLALHSFFYDEAVEEFRAAAAAEPGFVMARWGEAMSLTEALWGGQDLEGGRAALAQIPKTPKVTAREAAFVDAVRLLYGEGAKQERWERYAAAMKRMYARWPEDDEVATFYALAIMSAIPDDQAGVAERVEAGAIALDVYARNPEHPGAAHYVIHAFDDPTHAILALPAARRYARIAPQAFHALHMPSHIFVQLGMWDEAAAACEAAWAASTAWVKRRDLSIAKADFHSLTWLIAIYLEQGRVEKSRGALATFADAMAQSKGDDLRLGYLAAVYGYLGETEEWTRAEELIGAAERRGPATAASEAEADHCAAFGVRDATRDAKTPLRIAWLEAKIRAHAAAARGDAKTAQQQGKRMEALGAKSSGGYPQEIDRKWRDLDRVALEARLAVGQGKATKAAELYARAAGIVESMGGNHWAEPSAIPFEEQRGRALLQVGKAGEAAKAFSAALAERPGRVRALLGAARAAEMLGKTEEGREYAAKADAILHAADKGYATAR